MACVNKYTVTQLETSLYHHPVHRTWLVSRLNGNPMIDELQSAIASLLIKKIKDCGLDRSLYDINTYNEYSHGVPDQTIVFSIGGANFRAILYSINNAVNSLIEQLRPGPTELCIQVTVMPMARKLHIYALEIHMGKLIHSPCY